MSDQLQRAFSTEFKERRCFLLSVEFFVLLTLSEPHLSDPHLALRAVCGYIRTTLTNEAYHDR
jgi:hypothetical protein